MDRQLTDVERQNLHVYGEAIGIEMCVRTHLEYRRQRALNGLSIHPYG